MVTLKEELDIIHTYIQIQNDRSYQKVTFRTDIQDGLETFKIPKLLLQPLIENSISHGFYEQETGEILLSAKRKHDQVLITVKDNGKGFEINPLEYSRQEKHFGVYSVKHRLKIYYGEQGSIQYQSSNGTTVIISLLISDKEGQEACGTY